VSLRLLYLIFQQVLGLVLLLAARPPLRMSNSSCCATRSPSCASSTHVRAWTGQTGPCSPHRAGRWRRLAPAGGDGGEECLGRQTVLVTDGAACDHGMPGGVHRIVVSGRCVPAREGGQEVRVPRRGRLAGVTSIFSRRSFRASDAKCADDHQTWLEVLHVIDLRRPL
jgi:hypothetical protein